MKIIKSLYQPTLLRERTLVTVEIHFTKEDNIFSQPLCEKLDTDLNTR